MPHVIDGVECGGDGYQRGECEKEGAEAVDVEAE
jgi:hypothetical protein